MKRIIAGLVCALTITGASAADFFSTEKCDNLITYGARIGINTTNRTINKNEFNYSHESWGTGFDIGGVVNFNFRDYLTIQPGLFFESRSGRYTLMNSYQWTGENPEDLKLTETAQAGKRNSYNFTIPVMAVIGFNVTDEVRWNVEAGPYVAFVLNSKLKNEKIIPTGSDPLFNQKAASVDFGFKLGTGIKVMDHYYFGVHYLAGCVPAWKDQTVTIPGRGQATIEYGGLTKGWMFCLGYDF